MNAFFVESSLSNAQRYGIPRLLSMTSVSYLNVCLFSFVKMPARVGMRVVGAVYFHDWFCTL